MSESPAKSPRRRFTDAERLARIEAERVAIIRRAAEKQRERVVKARELLEEIDGLTPAVDLIDAWLGKGVAP